MSSQEKTPSLTEVLLRPQAGSTLTILSGLSFLVLCMLLPLVGKAGVETVHYGRNMAAFIAVLVLTALLSFLAVYSKVQRRKHDGSPRPFLSVAILGLCLLLLAALAAGLLKI